MACAFLPHIRPRARTIITVNWSCVYVGADTGCRDHEPAAYLNQMSAWNHVGHALYLHQVVAWPSHAAEQDYSMAAVQMGHRGAQALAVADFYWLARLRVGHHGGLLSA